MALGCICVVTYSRSTQVTFPLRSRLTLTMAVHCFVAVVNVHFGQLQALCKIVMSLFCVVISPGESMLSEIFFVATAVCQRTMEMWRKSASC